VGKNTRGPSSGRRLSLPLRDDKKGGEGKPDIRGGGGKVGLLLVPTSTRHRERKGEKRGGGRPDLLGGLVQLSLLSPTSTGTRKKGERGKKGAGGLLWYSPNRSAPWGRREKNGGVSLLLLPLFFGLGGRENEGRERPLGRKKKKKRSYRPGTFSERKGGGRERGSRA